MIEQSQETFAYALGQAHADGWMARMRGKGRETQPYRDRRDRDLAQSWDDGWCRADEELERDELRAAASGESRTPAPAPKDQP